MNLTDREILELNELCGALIDGTLTEAQRSRLARWLRDSEVARRYYVRALGQSASLQAYAAEVHADVPDRRPVRRSGVTVAWWGAGALAAAVAVVLWQGAWRRSPGATGGVADAAPYVARVTAAKDARWTRIAGALPPGALLRMGQRLELEAGFAEITFDSGARVVLAGAASFELNSAWDATLRRGALTASVPREAIGFRISNSAVEVLDLGTDFSMVANANGSADVFVLKGEVEASPRTAGDNEVILLRENESRRFEPSGASSLIDGEPTRARVAAQGELPRFARALHGVQWSFDEPAGDRVRGVARAGAGGTGSFDARLLPPGAGGDSALRTEGRYGRAVRLDGRVHGELKYPGISDNSQHTVAFWVRVPREAPLSDAYSMIAWFPAAPKLGHRPVGINWNRDPTEGPVGVLRTDFAGGCAMGATSLRDGNWHHIAVCFATGDSDESPAQVKQYVDGRLESGGIIAGRTRGPAGRPNAAFTDTVWIGCRLRANGPQQQRFKGEIDELVIADRSLEPREIVHLMRTNELPVATLAAQP